MSLEPQTEAPLEAPLSPATRETPPVPAKERLVLAAVAALGFSCVLAQLSILREMMGAFSGNEIVLGVVLGFWLLLMGAGTGLGQYAPRFRDAAGVFSWLQVVVALLPLAQIFLLRALRNVVFLRGAEVGIVHVAVCALVLLLPFCLVSGFMLVLAIQAAKTGSTETHGESATAVARLRDSHGLTARVYIADTLGSIGGGVLFGFVLSPFLDHLAILAVPAFVMLGSAAALAFTTQRPRLGWICGCLAVAVPGATIALHADRLSTRFQYRPRQVVAQAQSPYGRLVVTGGANEFVLYANGVPVASTRNVQHAEETVHFAMAQRPSVSKVLLVGGGFAGTAIEVLKYDVGRVDYVELDPELVKLARAYLPQKLADPRLAVYLTDGRQFVRRTHAKYDVVILDVPAPTTAQLNRFYTLEFFREIRRVLADDGVVSLGLGQYENFVSPDLARVLSSVRGCLSGTFSNSMALPGSRVFLLASDGPLHTDIAARMQQHEVKTLLMNRRYLDATLAPDRLADVRRASTQQAEANRDFNPTLYFNYLRHWLGQFDLHPGPVTAIVLALAVGAVVRLRGAAVVLFASGFAAAALELVLLLGFQVLCGSLYRQVGILVTVFMIGLALGAWLGSRSSGTPQPGAPTPPRAANRSRSRAGPARKLALLAWGIGVYAIMLTAILPQLARHSSNPAALVLVQFALALLTLLVALLVGMQFPIANRLEAAGDSGAPARLFSADFVGAFWGALLAGTLLLPLIGMSGVCQVTAGLNLVAGLFIYFRKPSLQPGS